MPIGRGVADKIKTYTSPSGQEDDNAVFIAQKGNTELIEKINTGLTNIRANGKYDEIYKKWFGDDQSLRVSKDKL